MQRRILPLIVGIALVAAACSTASGAAPGDAPEPVTYDEPTLAFYLDEIQR